MEHKEDEKGESVLAHGRILSHFTFRLLQNEHDSCQPVLVKLPSRGHASLTTPSAPSSCTHGLVLFNHTVNARSSNTLNTPLIWQFRQGVIPSHFFFCCQSEEIYCYILSFCYLSTSSASSHARFSSPELSCFTVSSGFKIQLSSARPLPIKILVMG